jgi:hypothetical protein
MRMKGSSNIHHRTVGITSEIECLTNKHEALSSNARNAKKKIQILKIHNNITTVYKKCLACLQDIR